MSCESDLERALIDKAAALKELNQTAREIPKYQVEIKRLQGVIEKLQSEKTAMLTQIESLQREHSNRQNEPIGSPTDDKTQNQKS
jgi:predicted  nucleic acid-binding Zn-ribbon protein